MMMKVLLALATVIGIASAQSDLLATIGLHAGEFNEGFCLAFQDNPADNTTTCFASCALTSAQIQLIFNTSDY